MSDIEKKPEQNYRIITPTGEKIVTVPGNRGLHDMRILSSFPSQPWATSLYYVACLLRLKGFVEDRNYKTGFGHAKLTSFILECICHPEKLIKEICRQYQIPIQENFSISEKQERNHDDLTAAVNAFWKEQGWA